MDDIESLLEELMAKIQYIRPRDPGPTLPNAPTGLTAATISTSQINLAWSAPPGISYFKVYVNNVFTGFTTNGFSLAITGLTTNTFYTFTVSAVTSNGEGPKSLPASAKTLASTLAITTNSPLPTATKGTPYSTVIAATGGTPPYTWSTTTTPNTGAWSSMNAATGAITGTPGTVETEALSVRVTDAVTSLTTKAFTMPVVASGAPTLLAYLKAAGPSTYMLSGATLNLFTTTHPLDALNTTTPSWPSVTVGAPGPATGKCPAIINTFTVVGPQVDSGSKGFFFTMGPSCPNFTGVNPAPNDWLSLTTGAKNAGCIPWVTAVYANPAGTGNNPWTFGGGVLNPGSATNTTFFGWLDLLVPSFKTIAALGPWVLAVTGENNLTNPNWNINGNNWTGISSGATTGQVAQLAQMVALHLKAAGVNNFLYPFQTNLGVGSFDYGYAPGIYDLCVCDSQPLFFDSTAYAFMQSTGLPMAYGSAIIGGPNGVAADTFNTYDGTGTVHTFGAKQIAQQYNFFGAIWWPQSVALNLQNGALQAMTTSPWIDKSQVPALSTGGGIYG